jgi:hypothetical protein
MGIAMRVLTTIAENVEISIDKSGEGGIRTHLKRLRSSFASWLAYRFTYVGR